MATGAHICDWCYKAGCDGRCAELTPAELAYTDRLIAAGIIDLPAPA